MSFFPLACAEQLENIGLQIKSRRLQRRIRQIDLANALELSVQTVRKVEAGTATVEIRAYLMMLWHLGMMDDVFPYVAPPAPSSPTLGHRVRLRKPAVESF